MRLQSIYCTGVLVALTTSFLQAQQPAKGKAQLVAVGEITLIGTAKRALELKTAPEANRKPGISPGGINLGVTIGKTRPNDPNRDVDSGRNSTMVDRDDTAVTNFRTTVYWTDQTSCKERETVILCSSLKVTDRVRVTGDERSGDRGRGLYAAEIVRIRN